MLLEEKKQLSLPSIFTTNSNFQKHLKIIKNEMVLNAEVCPGFLQKEIAGIMTIEQIWMVKLQTSNLARLEDEFGLKTYSIDELRNSSIELGEDVKHVLQFL